MQHRFAIHSALVTVSLFFGICLAISTSAEASDSRLDEVIAAFENRMKNARNIRYKVEMATDVHHDNNGQIGKLRSRIPLARYEYWQFDDSNRQDSVLTNSDGSSSIFSANFDAVRGVGMTRSGIASRPRGYIDSSRDPLMENNRYRFWLNIRDWGKKDSEYIFNYFLDHQETAQFAEDLEDGLLKVTTDYKPLWHSATCEGERILWLDPQKAFLPIRGFFEWKNLKSGLHRVERLEVTESSLVGDLWMPVGIKEHIRTSYSDGSTIHNLHTLRVTDIVLGKVTPVDLEIQFLPETYFADAIKGIGYIGDQKGNPLGPVEKMLSSNAVVAPPDETEVEGEKKIAVVISSPTKWQWFVRINVVVVVSLGLIYFARRFYSARS